MTLTLGELSGSIPDLLLVLATAALVSLVFARVRIAAIPAFLIAGAIIGLTPIAPDSASMETIGRIAIVLLMFGIGLHMDIAELAGSAARLLAIGLVAGFVCAVLLALGTLAFGESLASAAAIGIALSMSSTAAVIRLLQQRRELKQIHGRVAFAVLIVQDLAAIGALMAMPVLGAWDGGGAAGESTLLADVGRAGLGIAGVLVLLLVGRALLPRLLSAAAQAGGNELLLLMAAAIGLGAAVFTGALGLSPELGAFAAGVVLAGTPFRHELAGQLSPMRDLFMAVFFVTIGLGLDAGVLAAHWWVVLLGAVVCVAVKSAAIAATAYAAGLPAPAAVRVGLALAQAGEFTLVVLAAGQAEGLVSDEAMGVLAGVVGLSLIATPALLNAGARVGQRFARMPLAPWVRTPMATGPGESPALSGQVIVAGFGPIGREVASRCMVGGLDVTVIELNPKTVRKQAGLGRRVVYGDVTNAEVLHSAGIEHARAVILTMPDERAVLRACRMARTLNPGAFIAARSNYLSAAMQATALGADHVVVEEIVTARAMAEEVISRLRAREAEQPQVTESAPKISSADADPADRAAEMLDR